VNASGSKTAACTPTFTPGTTVPLDLPSLLKYGGAGTDIFQFTTPASALDVLSSTLPRALRDCVTSAEPFTRDAASAALFDLYMDLMRIGRAAVHLACAEKADVTTTFDASSPFLTFLSDPNAAAPSVIADIIPGRHGDFARSRPIKDQLRAVKSALATALQTKAGRIDVMAHGPLIEQHLASMDARTVNINPFVLPWPRPGHPPPEIVEMTNVMIGVFDTLVLEPAGVDGHFARNARAAARVFTSGWLNQAWHNHRYLSHSPRRFVLGDKLISAAPKMLGRSLAWLYRQQGREVWRVAHGGDRAFYDDDDWGLSELPFCDRYICHGAGESEAISARYASDRVIRIDDTQLVCEADGSNRHIDIWRDTHAAPRQANHAAGRKIRVLYANSSFLGEAAAHKPGISLTDIHFADLQVWLLSQLRAAGFEVIFKPHPKNVIAAPALYENRYDRLETRRFDPRHHDVDVYLFEYAGSAFFDALASDKGVVLVNPGLRPFDLTNEMDLRSRCEIVDAPEDDRNRFRPDPDDLAEAIHRAAEVRECPEWFARRYFMAPEHHSDGH